MTLLYIYLSLISICFLGSFRIIYHRNYLWLYFLYILLVEITVNFFGVKNQLYNYSIIFYFIFFYYFYFKKLNKLILNLISCFCFATTVFFILSAFQSDTYNTYAAITLSIYYIIISLLWFFEHFNKIDLKIHYKLGFWVSFSLLLYGVVFLFRIIPMQFFNLKDKEFLIVIRQIYQVFTIVSYFIFFIGILYSKVDE